MFQRLSPTCLEQAQVPSFYDKTRIKNYEIMGSQERLNLNTMAVTLNEVIRVQQMMVDVGKKLIHATIGNQDHSQLYNKSAIPRMVDNTSRWQDIIATDVELLAVDWRAHQSLGHDIQASLSFWGSVN